MDVRRLPILLPLLALALAGCGGSKSNGSAVNTPSGNKSMKLIRTITIKESEFRLDPNQINLTKAGDYVFALVNKGKLAHALEVEGQGLEAKSGTIKPGAKGTLRVTIRSPGNYAMYCPIDGHRAKGMKGTINLGGNGSPKVGTNPAGTGTGTSTSSGGY
jgi:uncharacterized cupredoxin-like copper-binding protein